MPSKNVAWIEDEVSADQLIDTIAQQISDAKLPSGEDTNWNLVFSTPFDKWVEYKQVMNSNVQGKYRHDDGVLYNVYVMNDYTTFNVGATTVSADGFLQDLTKTKKFQVKQITYHDEATGQDITLPVPGLLVALVNDPDAPLGAKVVVLEQGKKGTGDTFTSDPQWNEFRYICDMPSDWDYLMTRPGMSVGIAYDGNNNLRSITIGTYKFTERSYQAKPVQYIEKTYVLEATPDVPTGYTPTSYYVMFRETLDTSSVPYKNQYNYFDVIYGTGFLADPAAGSSASTYTGACDPATVQPGQVPTIIDMKKAEEIYLLYSNPAATGTFKPPVMIWDIDFDNKTEIKSPPAHFFYGANSVVDWVPNKKRRPDYWVSYFISVNNDRVAIVLEGDPAPDLDAYYRSFGYMGRINPFADYDVEGNFGVTVGMGDLTVEKTGFELDDIKQDTNPVYSGFGRYTSNGMYSMSMMRTRSKVLFQAYYPAFITQLPNYTGVGTLPSGLSTLELEKYGFQPSAWTEKYHASPIYLVHQYEGYRGFMEGLVAINDHNLINLDELVVDTEEPNPDKPGETWKEIYKFFSIKSPISFFKHSANPTECTIAILKEVK